MKQPNLVPIDERNYSLDEDYFYAFDGSRIVVRKGFVTDIASIPQIFWSLGLRPDGLCRAAALIHDVLYRSAGILRKNSKLYKYYRNNYLTETVFTRKECDEIFLKIMLEAGVSSFKAHLMYYAVRCCGKSSFKESIVG